MNKKIKLSEIENLSQSEEGLEILKTIELGDKTIEIYNPSEEICKEIINYIKANKVDEFTDVESIRYLFPLLTNLDFSDLTEDQVYKIISSNKLWLKQVKLEISKIINMICEIQLSETLVQIQRAENLLKSNVVINKMPVDKIEKIMNSNTAIDTEKVTKIDRLNKNLAKKESKVKEEIENNKKIQELENELKILKGESDE